MKEKVEGRGRGMLMGWKNKGMGKQQQRKEGRK
jgi:hypothetical protein